MNQKEQAPVFVEVGGTNFVNKGAELMMLAIWERLSRINPPCRIVLRPEARGFRQAYQLGIYRKLAVRKLGFMRNLPAYVVPRVLQRRFLLVNESDIDAYLDASGFAYSDQWGVQPALKLLHLAQRYKKADKQVILLPQAFGPFRNEQLRRVLCLALNRVDLVFARDRLSLEFVQGLGTFTAEVALAPDFTNLLEGKLPQKFHLSTPTVCIIPNYRMLDKTNEHLGQKYLAFLEDIIKYLYSQQVDFFILIHESAKDRLIVQALSEATGRQMNVICERNPIYIKGIISQCLATIGSRYHGLVSALCQGIPSLGVGWSHKYEMLFEDYNCKDLIVDLQSDSRDAYLEKVRYIINNYARIQNVLKESARIQKQLTQLMWSSVLRRMGYVSEVLSSEPDRGV